MLFTYLLCTLLLLTAMAVAHLANMAFYIVYLRLLDYGAL